MLKLVEKMGRMDVIDMIDRGEISVQEGISLIKQQPKGKHLKKGWLLKVSVKDEGRGFTFFVPLFLIDSGFLIAKRFLNSSSKLSAGSNEEKAAEVFKKLDNRDIRKIANELRFCKSTGFIKVHDKDSTVIISIV